MTVTELLDTWRERSKTSYHAHAWADAVEELEALLDVMPDGPRRHEDPDMDVMHEAMPLPPYGGRVLCAECGFKVTPGPKTPEQEQAAELLMDAVEEHIRSGHDQLDQLKTAYNRLVQEANRV